ncbi:ATP-binding protein [Cellulophaga sp. BC115SP]|uniref:ATP-binding protein n=1 Tax=Cellulophaga sp. BC115SP TaxID=2683263 RepID=UPI001411E48B|nr:ATP-binding protein [Cellulophaga sp. BC115SP]NBB31237.1 DUF4143 domain-containing protein [Cellulophaga sp. BC115SP]
MIKRRNQLNIIELLKEFPAVSILGPRQVGKTTLAEEIASTLMPEAIYMDLESTADLAKLSDPEAYFELHQGKLIILDEIQRTPELFAVLRGVIDRRRRAGFRTCQFLILGSASLELLKQSSESLAGRIAYQQLSGLNVLEIEDSNYSDIEALWLRGGFPDSFLAKSDAGSFRWRQNFILTYLERDVPQFGSRIPAISLRRLWTMLAHTQGSQLNTAQLGASLGITIPTVKRYIELLEDLFLVRTIYPWSGNVGKRLVKTPKVYIRDSGLTHALLNLNSLEDLLSHPVVGPSWEGFVIENIISCLPQGTTTWFYRTSAGAEIDLVVELSNQERYAIEVKRSSAPKISKGFYLGCEDIKATKRYVVYPGKEQFPFADGVMATPLSNLMKELTNSQ